jgi:hypothetical protein
MDIPRPKPSDLVSDFELIVIDLVADLSQEPATLPDSTVGFVVFVPVQFRMSVKSSDK